MLTFKLTINDTPIDNSLILDKVEFSTSSNNRDLSVGDFLFTIVKCKLHHSVSIQYGNVVKISIIDEEGIEHPYGIFEPYNITHTDFSTDVELYAMPVFSLMKEYTPLFPSSSYTTQTLLQEMQLELGFTVATSDNFLIQSITMGVIESDTGINLLSKIALQLGGNVFINREGKVEFKILSRNTFTIPSSQITQVTRGENEYSITQVVGKTGNGDKDTTYTSGTFTTDAHTLTVTSPYITQAVTDRILTILQDVRYYAYKLKVFDFPLQANMYDMITFTHNRTTNENLINEITLQPLVENDDLDLKAQSTQVSFPIMNLKLTFSSDGLVAEAESLVSSEASKDTGYKGSFTKRLEVIKNITQELDTKIEVIDGNVSSVINKTTALESDVTTVKNQQSSINQSLTSITNRVEANETNLSQNYLTKNQTISQIEQTASSITQEVVKEEVGKITIGAMNYILKSNVETNLLSKTTNDNTKYSWTLSQNTPYINTNCKTDNATFTLSIWLDVGITPFTNVVIGTRTISVFDFTVKQVEENLFRLTYTFTVEKDTMLSDEYGLAINCHGGGWNCNSNLKFIQLEEGSVASSYQESLEDIIDDYNNRIDTELENIINSNSDLQSIVMDILSDDFISESERANLILIWKEIQSGYTSVLSQVNTYDENDYFSAFTEPLITNYQKVEYEMNLIINENKTDGKAYFLGILADYYDTYHELLFVISQYLKTKHEMMSTEINQLSDRIDLVVTSIDDMQNEQKKYMRFSQDGLELFTTINGNIGKFKMRLSENRLSFFEGNKEVAYLSNEKLYISSAEITNELKIGTIVGRRSSTSGFVFQEDK